MVAVIAVVYYVILIIVVIIRSSTWSTATVASVIVGVSRTCGTWASAAVVATI